MKNKRPFLIAGLVGLLVIVTSLLLMVTFPKHAAYMANGFKTPIIYYEFIETVEDTQAFFGMTENMLPNDIFIEKMNFGNKIDFVYAILYSLFLFLFALKLTKISGKKLYSIVMLLAIIAAIADIMENIQLLQIPDKLLSGDFSSELSLLHVFTWIKWGSLALSCAILSDRFFRGKIFSKIIGIIAIVPLILAIIAYKLPGFYSEIFSLSISVMFVILISYSFIYKTTSVKSDIA